MADSYDMAPPMLSKGPQLEKREQTGMSVLTHAILSGNIRLMKWLCKMGEDDVNHSDEFGITPAHYACQVGSLEALKILVKYDANLELRTKEGYTPLMLALIKGRLDCAKYLINECKCDLLTTDADGLNAFQRCCASGELSMVEWLIEHGGFRPYINVPTTASYSNVVKIPKTLPDLSVAVASTELYIKELMKSSTINELRSIRFDHDESNGAINQLIHQVNEKTAPIVEIDDQGAPIPPGGKQYTAPVALSGNNPTTTIAAAPVITGINGSTTPGAPVPGGSSRKLTSFGRSGSSKHKQSVGAGPNQDNLYTPLNTEPFDTPLDLCKSRLVAYRAIAKRSGHFAVNAHIDFCAGESIFVDMASTASVGTNNNNGTTGTTSAYSNQLIDPTQQLNTNINNGPSWEDKLPSYTPPKQGELPFLQRAYEMRNTVLDEKFYDRAVLSRGDSVDKAVHQYNKMVQEQHLLKKYKEDKKQYDQLVKQNKNITIPQPIHPDILKSIVRLTDEENLESELVEFPADSTPLMLAAGYGHQHIVNWLLTNCDTVVDVNQTNQYGLKAWQLALKSHCIPLFIQLYQATHNATLQDVDRFGNTPLLRAILDRDYDTFLFLLALGADPTTKDQNGKTLLMHAAIQGQLDMVRVLIDCGLDLTIENNDGHDVQTIAVTHSQWAVVKLLEDALEQQAMAKLEAEMGLLMTSGDGGRATLQSMGLDDASDITTIDWNSVMQAAQDLDIDVVDYCNRANIDIKLLDKSGRNFLHHATVNGRFEHVKVLVEKGNMNIRAKQTKAFRIYAKPTKGMNTLEMALHKKWYSIYCYLFLESTLFHDSRRMDKIIYKHTKAFSDLEQTTIQDFAICARNALYRTPNPLIMSLRLNWMFLEISKYDRIHRNLYEELALKYNQYAIKLLNIIPHPSLIQWVLEEPDALNNTAMKVATLSNNTLFLSNPLVDKALSLWWYQSDDPYASYIFPLSHLVRRPRVKRWLQDCSVIARVVLFTIFLCYRIQINDSFHIIEWLMYIFTLGQTIPLVPPSTKRVNAVVKKNITQTLTGDGTNNEEDDKNISIYSQQGGAPEHQTTQQIMQQSVLRLTYEDDQQGDKKEISKSTSKKDKKKFAKRNKKTKTTTTQNGGSEEQDDLLAALSPVNQNKASTLFKSPTSTTSNQSADSQQPLLELTAPAILTQKPLINNAPIISTVGTSASTRRPSVSVVGGPGLVTTNAPVFGGNSQNRRGSVSINGRRQSISVVQQHSVIKGKVDHVSESESDSDNDHDISDTDIDDNSTHGKTKQQLKQTNKPNSSGGGTNSESDNDDDEEDDKKKTKSGNETEDDDSSSDDDSKVSKIQGGVNLSAIQQSPNGTTVASPKSPADPKSPSSYHGNAVDKAQRAAQKLFRQQQEQAQKQRLLEKRQRKDAKELQKQLQGKRSSNLELFTEHVTSDGWAVGDVIIALITLVMLIVRVIPERTGGEETTRYVIYLVCISALPLLYYWRLLELFLLMPSTGPQLIMVFKMVDDILKFGVLFIVPMVAGYLQYFYLALDPRQPDAEGYEDTPAVIITLWNAWWNQVAYDFSDFDTPRRVLLIIVSIVLTFIASWFLFNMLVGIMAATIDDVLENSHSEFASQLVQTRWKVDQQTLQPPPPFNILHILIVQLIQACVKLPFLKKYFINSRRKDLWCAYCGVKWDNDEFSITKPLNGSERRFPPYVLFEYSPQQAAKRLCRNCLRAQRVLNWDKMVSEWVAEKIIIVLIFLPLCFYILFIYPFTLCMKTYNAWKIKKEYDKGSKRLISLFGTTPYDYSFFQTNASANLAANKASGGNATTATTLPRLTFQFEYDRQRKQQQLNTVTHDDIDYTAVVAETGGDNVSDASE